MKPYYEQEGISIYHGDCRAVLPVLGADSIDAVVTDPPYGLEFMGKDWDRGVPGVPFWEAALRVAKPGAHLLAFGGDRTHHRLMVAIEDAGWEIRTCIMWVYGQGFPKSLDVSKAIDKAAGAEREVVGPGMWAGRFRCGISSQHSNEGWKRPSHAEDDGGRLVTAPATDAAHEWEGWGTALKPAWEPIIVARKPLAGTVAANVLRYGTGGLNIEGCRVATSEDLNGGTYSNGPARRDVWSMLGGGGGLQRVPGGYQQPSGRWPANLVHDGSEEVLALFPVTAPLGGPAHSGTRTAWPGGKYQGTVYPGDTGSAARFFASFPAETTEDLLLCRAEAIIDAWKQEHAPTAENHSSLSSQAVASALSVAATWASQGEIHLSACPVHSMSATLSELRQACASVIRLILSTEPRYLLGSYLISTDRSSPNLARYAAIQRLTDTTPTTPSPTSSAGFAVAVTLKPTSNSTVVGEADSPSRFRYCAKASRSERGEGNDHPTVKPLALMRWLCRLVTPPGGTLLDPFLGSGSTLLAASKEGFQGIGIDLKGEHCEIAANRLRRDRLPLEVYA